MRKRCFPKIIVHFMIVVLICGQLFPTFYVYAEEIEKNNDEKEELKDDSDDEKAEEKSDESDEDEKKSEDEKDSSEDDSDDEKIEEKSEENNQATKQQDDAISDDVPSEKVQAISVSDLEKKTDSALIDQKDPFVGQNISDNVAELQEYLNYPKNVLNDDLTEKSVQLIPIEEGIVLDACQCPVKSSEEDVEGEDVDPICPETCPEMTINNVNDAVISDNIVTNANTGNNEQNDKVADSNVFYQDQEDEILQVETGDAESLTVVNNNINTNVITQNGDYLNIDIYGDYISDINLLEVFQKIISDARDQDDPISSVITNINNAELNNDVLSEAITGANEIIGAADVNTGSATAITDVVNYVNTNIVGNNWLYTNVNIFGNWIGDLIVPGEGLLTTSVPRVFRDTFIINENYASVDNNVLTTADTGGNSTIAETINIQTGDAISETNVINIINTNIVKNNWFLLFVNNMGNWQGKLLNWGDENYSDVLAYDIAHDGSIDISPSGSLAVYNENHADISNNVVTTALSGNNIGGSEITTGNAWAITNVFNMINTNIIGDNWFFGVVNNMGNWQGDVEFAYPDLTIAIDDGLDKVLPDQAVEYTIQYKNTGQADCESVTIDLTLPEELTTDETSWNLPGMKAGEEKTLNIQVKINNYGNLEKSLKVIAEISTTTKEIKLDNNQASDQTTLAYLQNEVEVTDPTDNIYEYYESVYDYDDLSSEIDIKRFSSAYGLVVPGDSIQNTIIVENKGENTVYNIFVNDKMLDENDTELVEYSWMIGNMEKGDKIMIQYELLVNNPGQKVNITYAAKAKGVDGYGEKVNSNKDSTSLMILGYTNLVSIADAAEVPVSLEDVQLKQNEQLNMIIDNEAQSPDRLPFWIWLMSIIAFYLAIDWALFPKKNNPSI